MEIAQKLVTFVNKGGLAIVFLRPMPTLQYQSREGRRRSVAAPLEKFLPWGENLVHRAHGSNIEFSTQGPFGRFWETTDGLWSYEAVYDDPPEQSRLAHVRGHPEEVVADFIVTENSGFEIMTPVPSFENNRGDMQISKQQMEVFVQAVKDLHEALRAEGPAPQLPDWAGDYSLPGEM